MAMVDRAGFADESLPFRHTGNVLPCAESKTEEVYNKPYDTPHV